MTGCLCSEERLRRTGRHSQVCPLWREETLLEYRAVFSYPSSILGKTRDSYGPWRSDLTRTLDDRPYRPEESLGWRSGFETRPVSAITALKVYIEIDAVPLMQDPRADDRERDIARSLHGVWFDPEELAPRLESDAPGLFATTATRSIVYREDGAPAIVHNLRRDWSRR